MECARNAVITNVPREMENLVDQTIAKTELNCFLMVHAEIELNSKVQLLMEHLMNDDSELMT